MTTGTGPQLPQEGCLVRLLNVREHVRSVRMSLRNIDAGEAFGLFFLFGIGLLVSGILWWEFDLMSTWTFSQGLRQETAGTVNTLATRVNNLQVAMLMVAAIATSFTILPSVVEFIAPVVVNPLMLLALRVSITFDYITDWDRSWAFTANWSIVQDWGFIGHVLCAMLWNLMASLLFQGFAIICLVACITCVLTIIGGGGRRPAARVIEVE